MDAENKAKFKKGCEDAGGTWAESPDGTFQCKVKSGAVVKCSLHSDPCTFTAKIAPGTRIVVDVDRAAIDEVLRLPPGKPSKRSPAPKTPAKNRN